MIVALSPYNHSLVTVLEVRILQLKNMCVYIYIYIFFFLFMSKAERLLRVLPLSRDALPAQSGMRFGQAGFRVLGFGVFRASGGLGVRVLGQG